MWMMALNAVFAFFFLEALLVMEDEFFYGKNVGFVWVPLTVILMGSVVLFFGYSLTTTTVLILLYISYCFYFEVRFVYADLSESELYKRQIKGSKIKILENYLLCFCLTFFATIALGWQPLILSPNDLSRTAYWEWD